MIGVMHVIDTLDAGGAERVAVALANALPADRFSPHLCTTRRDGPLAPLVGSHVGRLQLGRASRFDLAAIVRLQRYVRVNDIRLLHAHGASVFISVVAASLPPHPRVIWHVHSGRHAAVEPPRWLYGPAARRARRILTVSEPLSEWVTRSLGVPPARVTYLPNFSMMGEHPHERIALPGTAGSRIVCVANLRPEKGHHDLIQEVARMCRTPIWIPSAHQ